MNPLAFEWIQKAEGDFYVANREYRARKNISYDAVCYHCQQKAEKYLKACLLENSFPIPRTHSLMELLADCLKTNNSFHFIQTDLSQLEGYSVQFRYPGQTAEKIDAQRAMKSARVFRQFLKTLFELD